MTAAYVFRATFRLDPSEVTVDPARFETVVTRPAPEPGTDGWLFFRDELWRGEVNDEGHLRSLAEGWLGVPVESVTFSELRLDGDSLDALRDEIAASDEFEDSPQAVLHAHLGSSIRLE
jgi:hypothetical protein